MEILNPSPVVALPHAMWLVYRAVAGRDGLNRHEVSDLVVPMTLRPHTPVNGSGDHVKQALKALIDLGLVSVSSDDLLTAEPLADARAFVRRLRRRIMVATTSTGVYGAPDLRSGLVWLMRQAPTNPLDFDNVQASMPSGLFTNGTRWNSFRQWATVLGFGVSPVSALSAGRGVKASGEKIVANPTAAVRDVLQHPYKAPLPREEKLPVGQFIANLREELPMLPGHPSATYPGLDTDVSNDLRALGLALTTVELQGLIKMSYQSDPTGVMALPDAKDYGRNRYVSTVTIKDAQ